jgi:predicted lipoprotein with Yx(FWY)xxD motif
VNIAEAPSVYVSESPYRLYVLQRSPVTTLTSVSSRRIHRRRRVRLATAALAAGVLSTSASLAVASAASSTIDAANVPHFAGALVNQSAHSLYILSSEKGATLKCTGSCLSSWLPLDVTTSTKSISLGAGVAGKIGFVARGKSKKQVTFNSYPLYTFVGDTFPRQSHGEGIRAFGGTWTLVKAGAKSAPGTAFTAAAAPTTTTTTAPTTTTTTTPGGGGGVAY